ncbi:MAG: hypothetical protein AB1665_08355 [Candidatus Thermoplasmatota archaeon]
MKTYVTLTLSSEGAPASGITKALLGLGFKPALGEHDFVYRWADKHVTTEQVIEFIDKVQSTLKGMGVGLHFTTLR